MLDNDKWKMHTSARAAKQYISPYENLFENGCMYIITTYPITTLFQEMCLLNVNLFLLTSQAKPYNWSYDTRDDQCKTEILFYKLSCP